MERKDGRQAGELRPIKMETGVLKRADGSCYLEWGKNKVFAAVYGPRPCFPKREQDPLKARLVFRYNLAPFSVDERKRPGPDRRSVEISKVSREALERVVLLEYFPRTSIDVFVEVLQADAGTRCAALSAAVVALADAGIPMKDLVSATAVGKLGGEMAVDLNKLEEDEGDADMPVSISPRTKNVVLLQMDGMLTRDEFMKGLELAIESCMKVNAMQKEALKKRYEGVEGNGIE